MNEDKLKALRSLKTARGQIEGIIKMIETGQYCIDISNQIAAASTLMKNAHLAILTQHLHHCVTEAVTEGDKTKKIEEIISIFSKLLGK